MTLPAAWALQIGLRAHLATDAGVAAMLGVPARIYDQVPDDACFPLLTIGPARIRAYDGVDVAAEHEIRIGALSRWGGRKEVKELTDLVCAALHNRSFPIDPFKVVSSRFVFADILRRVDNETYQSAMRFRIVTEQPPQGV